LIAVIYIYQINLAREVPRFLKV